MAGCGKSETLYIAFTRLMVIRTAQVLEVIKKTANGNTLVPSFVEYAVPLSFLPGVGLL